MQTEKGKSPHVVEIWTFFLQLDRLKTKMTAIKNKEHLTTIIRISQSPSSEKKGHVFEKNQV